MLEHSQLPATQWTASIQAARKLLLFVELSSVSCPGQSRAQDGRWVPQGPHPTPQEPLWFTRTGRFLVHLRPAVARVVSALLL